MFVVPVSGDLQVWPVGDACTLRLALPEEAGVLADIDAGNPSPWSQKRFTSAIDRPGDTVLLAQYRGEIVGFVIYSRVLDEASVLNITVRGIWRGQGMGRQLLADSLARMKDEGLVRCLLEVRQSNKVARRLYEGMGFHLDGERRNYYPGAGARENALLMSRDL